ncbi:MAG: DNA primase [Clostridia bacterium]|nr:DNA primase [Clostridia bacterium]
MIPANVIEDLKYRNRIEDVVGSYVTLSRSGANLKGLCPFHSEKTPSFTVFPNDGHYYCFGCGEGGDVITFTMKLENLDYRGALDFLAKRSGVTLPEDDKFTPKGVSRQRVLEMNKCAARFFRDMLFDPEIGAPGREYLLGKRGLSSAVVKRFGLGYAPNSFNALRDHLRKNGFTREEMVEGYLCQVSKKNDKNIYDCFRNRVMFPIIDVTGNVIAFGGRVLDDSKPKYLNSADTPAFRKSRNLFALNYARNFCSENLILCEGYMDVIALHSAGFQNAVATLGTAITPDQARLMKRYSDKVVISYDSDEAGRKAASKALKLLSEAGVDSTVLKMQGAKDPDEYISKFGADRFKKLISEGRSEFDFKIDGIKERYDFDIPEQKVKAGNALVNEIASYYSVIEREVYIGKAAEVLGMPAESIKADVNRVLRKKRYAEKKTKREELIRSTSAIGDRVNPDEAKSIKCARLEKQVLGMMLSREEFMKAGALKLNAEDFYTSLNKRLFEFIKKAYENGGFDIGMLGQEFVSDEISRAVAYKDDRERLNINTDKAFDEAAENLKAETARQKKKDEGGEDAFDLIARRRKEVNK